MNKNRSSMAYKDEGSKCDGHETDGNDEGEDADHDEAAKMTISED